jgi:gluconate 2-dehydrogenase alpha chain
MRRESHVRFWEGGGVRLPSATRLAVPFIQDELRYYWRHELFQEASRQTLTFRNSPDETALRSATASCWRA